MLRYLWEASFLVKKKSSISVRTEFGQNRHKNLLWCIYKNHFEVESKWDFTCSIFRITWFFGGIFFKIEMVLASFELCILEMVLRRVNCAFLNRSKPALIVWNILFLTLFLALSLSCRLLSFSWENCLVWVFTLSWHALSRTITLFHGLIYAALQASAEMSR